MSFNKDLYHKIKGGTQRMYESFDSHAPILQKAARPRATNLEAMGGRKNGSRSRYDQSPYMQHADGGAAGDAGEAAADGAKEAGKKFADDAPSWVDKATTWAGQNPIPAGLIALIAGSYIFRRRSSIEQQIRMGVAAARLPL